MTLYNAVMYCTKGVRGQKIPQVSGDKRFQGCQGTEGAKGAWVKSLEGLLRVRVFSRRMDSSSLSLKKVILVLHLDCLKCRIIYICCEIKCFTIQCILYKCTLHLVADYMYLNRWLCFCFTLSTNFSNKK